MCFVHCEVSQKLPKMLEILCAAGCSGDKADAQENKLPLHYLAIEGDYELFRAVLKYVRSLNAIVM